APAAPPVDWAARRRDAGSDDAALLALARDASPLEVKLEAVGAIAGEATLKRAEREFREHDRRVHRLAKQRLQAVVARRETGEQAARLIEAARALAAEPRPAVNQLVELDRGWQALDATLIDAAQAEAFAALNRQLTQSTQQRAEAEQRHKRWIAQAQQALTGLKAAADAAAVGAGAGDAHPDAPSPAQALAQALTQAKDAALARLSARTEGGAAAVEGADATRVPHVAEVAEATVAESIHRALADADALEARLALLDQLTGGAAAPSDAPPPRWQDLPPLTHAGHAAALDARYARWQQAQDEARGAQQAQRRAEAKDRQRLAQGERSDRLAQLIELAEADLAAGHLGPTHQHLVEIDELLHGGGLPSVALRTRIEALQADYARLKGWQHWAGGRARDDLTDQAEALAAAGAEGRPALKLSIKERTTLIDELRAQWKELDRLGGATSRALWQRFDAALKTAYQPVAEQIAAQRAAREQNLASRLALLDALDAVALPEGEAADWREVAGAVDRFRAESRKLGPLEHTVPHKSREALVQRMNAALARLETPLEAVRLQARAARERLIEAAGALGTDAPPRELTQRVRQLQDEWQQQARTLPLGRGDEQALWQAFRGAIDGIFSARDAAFNAREAQYQAQGAERLALIERLEALAADAPVAELKRNLAEVHGQWQRTGPAPRADAAALDTRYERAHEAVRRYIAGSESLRWQAQCDALAAKLALCDALEAAGGLEPDSARADLEARWAAIAALPPAWEQALAGRAGLAPAVASPSKIGIDEALLQIEAAWELPTPPEHEAKRRELKLLALKAAMEGRRGAAPPEPEALFASLLARADLSPAQRQRQQAAIAGLRRRGKR
ncbi:MAG: DUF349 domain-containing protein, partial [Burkholderiales bacterium]|nr:DUF349 domain-containing protein [Burkholderiales bacterium]